MTTSVLHADDQKWHVRLAAQRKIRLPRTKTALTTSGMEKWLRALGLSVTWYRNWSGMATLKEFIVANPDWALRDTVGLWLEVGAPKE